MRLIIVGAGVYGSVLAQMARLRGMDAVLVDPAPRSAASQSALAVMKATWHPVAEALNWYALNGSYIQGAWVSNWRNPSADWRKDWYLVDPSAILQRPDMTARAVGWDVPGQLLLSDGTLLRGTVILSHPVWTDEEPASWGATGISSTAEVDGGGLRVHALRPYHSLFAGRTGDVTRVGSSVESTRSEAVARAREMVSEASALGLVSRVQDWTYRVGRRWPESEDRCEPGLIRLGGLARLGFTLAPGRAARLLDQLTKQGG